MMNEIIKNKITRILKETFGEAIVKMESVLGALDLNNIDHKNSKELYGGNIYNFLRKNFKTIKRGYYYFGDDMEGANEKIRQLENSSNTTRRHINVNTDYIFDNINEHLTFGCEIEFASYYNGNKLNPLMKNIGLKAEVVGNGSTWSCHGNNISYENWNITYDSSISTTSLCNNKIEIVSPVLKGKEGLKELQKVLDFLSGLENERKIIVNKSCGLHIHIGDENGNLKEWQMFNLIRMYQYNEKVIDLIMPKSRRGNSNAYCSSVRIGNYISSSSLDNYSRTTKLNLNSYASRGTIEFRHHSGTVNFEKVGNWILLIQRMYETSKDPEFDNVRNTKLSVFFKSIGLNDKTFEFYKNRVNDLNGENRSESDLFFDQLTLAC